MTRRSGSGLRSRSVVALIVFFAGALPTLAQSHPTEARKETPGDSDAILWYPAPSHCAFFSPESEAAFRSSEPTTWRFRFLVMRETGAKGNGVPIERGYVMKDGLLRELETVRSGPDAGGATVTVWRSAGEPRINITTTLRPDGRREGRERFVGTLQTIRGDGRDSTPIQGTCAPEASDTGSTPLR